MGSLAAFPCSLAVSAGALWLAGPAGRRATSSPARSTSGSSWELVSSPSSGADPQEEAGAAAGADPAAPDLEAWLFEHRAFEDEAGRGIELCMLVALPWGGLLVWAAALALLGLLESEPPLRSASLTTLPMPSAWDRRYVRETERRGSEAAVLRKGKVAGEWLLYLPDGALRAARLSDRKTIATVPVQGVLYRPLPVLSQAAQEAAMTAAVALVEGPAPLPQLRPYTGESWRTIQARRFCWALLGWPAVAARWLRWSLRSPSRFAGLLVLTYGVYDLTDRAGLFSAVRRSWEAVQDAYQSGREQLMDASDTLAAWIAWAEGVHSFVSQFISPWLLLGYVGCGLILLWATTELSRSGSDSAESEASSAASSPPDSPRVVVAPSVPSPADPALLAHLERQTSVLSQLAAGQKALEEQLRESQTDSQARGLLEGSRAVDQGGWRDSDREALSSMRARLESFAEALERDRAPRAHASASASQDSALAVAGASAGAASSADAQGSLPTASGSPSGKDAAPVVVGDAIRRLELQARQPQAVFLEALKAFQPIPEERWNRYFPVGYRSRVAPEFLADVYSSGRRAREWAREWLRERSLLECTAARELMAVMAALDTLLFEDGHVDFINHIGTERLAKKALGLYRAFEPVRREADWKRPSGAAAKTFKSKIDWESQRRVDPQAAEADGFFKYRNLEDETRHEIEREANILKARAKLEERRKQDQEPAAP